MNRIVNPIPAALMQPLVWLLTPLLTPLLIVTLVLFLGGCKRQGAAKTSDDTDKNRPTITRLVEVVEITTSDFEVRKSYVGHLEPNQRVKLHAEVEGVVKDIDMREGKRVVNKQELFRISSAEMGAQRDLSKNNYQLANSEYERSKKLHVENLISPAELEKSFNTREVARLNLRLAELNYAKSVIRAPFDGVIFKLSVESGEFVSKGRLLAEVLDVKNFKAAIQVPEEDVVFFRPDLSVQLSFDALSGVKQAGRVFSVSQEADQSSRSFTIEVITENSDGRLRSGELRSGELRSGKLRSGMLVRVNAKLAAFVNQVLAPRHALIESDQGTFVFIIKDGVAVARKVVTGISRSNLVQITNGLKAGELMVVSGQHKLADNTPVRVRKVEIQTSLEADLANGTPPDDA